MSQLQDLAEGVKIVLLVAAFVAAFSTWWYLGIYRPVLAASQELGQLSRALAASVKRWQPDGEVSVRNRPILGAVCKTEVLARGTWGGLPASIQYDMRESTNESDDLPARTTLRLIAPRQLAKSAGIKRFPPDPNWAWIEPLSARLTKPIQQGAYQYNPVADDFNSWGINGEERHYFTPAILARLRSLPLNVFMGGFWPGVYIEGAEIRLTYPGHVHDPSAIEAGFGALEEIAALA